MGTLSAIQGRRRSAAQRHALVRLEREIRAADPNGKLKYLRDYAEAYSSYERPLSPTELEQMLAGADVVLVGDYHALPASQAGAAQVLEQCAAGGREVVLGLETVFVRDQQVLDDWTAGDIDEQELRERIRYDVDWGYDWEPFAQLLRRARQLGAAVYGLDCEPRDDMRKIAARDRHAAAKIAELRARHPNAAVVVLFGESHLAPNHLPLWLNLALPTARVLTVLQNVDALYWRATSEREQPVKAVKVRDDVVCVFNATPLEKYESYRICIERWRQERATAVDLAPTFYNLIDALVRFLGIEKYSPSNGTQPIFLVDRYPEVVHRPAESAMRRFLLRKRATPAQAESMLKILQARGCHYWPDRNVLLVRAFDMAAATEETARFLQHACRKEPPQENTPEGEFYRDVVEAALTVFGSRVLYPARTPLHEYDLYAMYAMDAASVAEKHRFAYRDYLQLVDFLVLHKDFEAHHARYWHMPEQLRQGIESQGQMRRFVVERLGAMLGNEIYDAYIAGRVSKRWLRSLFMRKTRLGYGFRQAYYEMARRTKLPQRRLAA